MATSPNSADLGQDIESIPLHPHDPPGHSTPMETYEPPPDGSVKPKISLQQVWLNIVLRYATELLLVISHWLNYTGYLRMT